jgi:hypothetical protein
MRCTKCDHSFVIKQENSATIPSDPDDEPDTDEHALEEETLREHLDEDEDDLPTDERITYTELDQDDYETVIEPSAVLEALQDRAAAEPNENEEDFDTDVVDLLEADDDDLSNAVAANPQDEAKDIDGFKAATEAAYTDFEDEDEDDPEPTAPGEEDQGDQEEPGSSDTISGFSLKILSPSDTEEDAEEFTEDENTDEDDTDAPTNPIGPPPGPHSSEPRTYSSHEASPAFHEESPAPPEPPQDGAAPPLPDLRKPPAEPQRSFVLPLALFVVIVISTIAFMLYQGAGDPQSTEPPVPPAVHQQ